MSILTSLRKMIGAENYPITTASLAPATGSSLTPFQSLPLKVKIKNLSAEADIIWQEEQKQLEHARAISEFDGSQHAFYRDDHFQAYYELRDHRETVVCDEQRATLLAYGFLRGKSYLQIEPRRYSDPLWEKIEYMALTYARGMRTQDVKQNFERWKQEAGEPSACQPKKPRVRPSNMDERMLDDVARSVRRIRQIKGSMT